MSTGNPDPWARRPWLNRPVRAAPTDASSVGRGSGGALIGLAALAVSVSAAAWVGVGAAGGSRWLELPTARHPAWTEGPLHGLTRGAMSAAALGAGVLILAGAYPVALSCAKSIPQWVALLAVGLATSVSVLAPSFVSTDVFGYIAYAREFAGHGLNPYVVPPAALGHDAVLPFVYWKRQTSPYGPLFTLASAPLGLMSVPAAFWTLKVLTGVAAFAIAAVTAAVAAMRGENPARAAIFVGLNPVVLVYAVPGAHNDVLAVTCLVCALALMSARRSWAAPGASAAVAAAAVKITLSLGLPFVVLAARRRGRALGGAALALAVIGVPTLLLFGPHLFDQLTRIASDPRFDIRWSGPDVVARVMGSRITPAIRALCQGAAALVAAVLAVRAWRGADPVVAAGWAILALLSSIASLAPWYLVWLLPLASAGRSRTLRWATSLASAYVLAVHLPALGGHLWLSSPSEALGVGP